MLMQGMQPTGGDAAEVLSNWETRATLPGIALASNNAPRGCTPSNFSSCQVGDGSDWRRRVGGWLPTLTQYVRRTRWARTIGGGSGYSAPDTTTSIIPTRLASESAAGGVPADARVTGHTIVQGGAIASSGGSALPTHNLGVITPPLGAEWVLPYPDLTSLSVLLRQIMEERLPQLRR